MWLRASWCILQPAGPPSWQPAPGRNRLVIYKQIQVWEVREVEGLPGHHNSWVGTPSSSALPQTWQEGSWVKRKVAGETADQTLGLVALPRDIAWQEDAPSWTRLAAYCHRVGDVGVPRLLRFCWRMLVPGERCVSMCPCIIYSHIIYSHI